MLVKQRKIVSPVISKWLRQNESDTNDCCTYDNFGLHNVIQPKNVKTLIR